MCESLFLNPRRAAAGQVQAATERGLWLADLDARRVPSNTALFGYHGVGTDWEITYECGIPEHLIYLIVSGFCTGVAGGTPVELGPGSAIWMTPHVPFALRTTGTHPMAVYRFRLLPGGDADAALAAVTVLRDAWELRGTFDALVAELGSTLPFREQRIHGLLIVLFTSIFRLTDGHGTGRPLEPAQRRAIEDYVDTRIAERPTVAELAGVVGLSTDYFVRRFRDTFGEPPKAWLVRRRIQHAAVQLDETTHSITRIARNLGYLDVSLFSRQFKAIMGLPPRAYHQTYSKVGYAQFSTGA